MKLFIEHLTHSYDIDVLNNISFRLEGYNSVAIIGASGSGKSTLLRILSGLEKQTTGKIQVNDLDIRDKVYRDQIGFVFQSHNLFPHLTLERNISLILEKTRGIHRLEASAIAQESLNLVQLGDQMHKLPKNVSGGQAQRASIARAFALNPNIIFLDEPTSSLDPVLTYEVLSVVKDLKKLGKSFIFVTHVMSFVKDFADYVIFMDKGLIVEHGKPSILSNPSSPELQFFISHIM
jgi:polar amino acid transport system ATP-binding protein